MFDGERLADLRKDAGLSQGELAKELNISRDMLSRYERGFSTPPDEVKLSIARYFNVSLDYLMCLINEQVSFERTPIFELPNNFPIELANELKEYAKYLIYRNKIK